VSDGTESGTALLTEVGLIGATELRASTYLSGSASGLWRSDGTPSGTSALPGSPELLNDPWFSRLVPAGGHLYLPTREGIWRFDSTTASFEELFADVEQPSGFFPLGTEVAFAASDAQGRELWTYDTVTGVTTRRTDLLPGAGSGLWSWVDGTQLLLFSDYFDPEPAANGTVMARIGPRLFFTAETPSEGVELWTYTPGTTPQIVADLVPGAGSSFPEHLTALGSTLYFVATDAAAGRELWRTDGTLAGTARVADLAPGPASSLPLELLPVGHQLLFSAHRSDVGRELWSADSTGVALLADVAPGALSSSPTGLTAGPGGRVFFAAHDGASGFELWSVVIDTGEIFVDGFESGSTARWSSAQ
jgi:ELWxxDGT repeat protein